ncbi:MAG: glycosyltransferase family 4 protein [Alphaproteobacteria bacterium]
MLQRHISFGNNPVAMAKGTGKASIEKGAAGTRPPAVLQVLPHLVTGGVERGTVDIAAALIKAGWRSLVASNGGPMVRELERAGARHFTLPLHSKNPFIMRANSGRLFALIGDHGVDIVHARSRAPAWSAKAAARRAGAHFLTTFHGAYSTGSAPKRLYNAVMTRGERTIAISDFIARHIQDSYRVNPEKIRVVHRGVDIDQFDPGRVADERMIELAKRWRLPDDRRIIMLPGRPTRWKGQGVLIEALAKLDRPDVLCLLVGADQGSAAYRRGLETLIAGHGLDEVVRLTEYCRDMPAAYMLSDVVVSASTRPEGFGRVVAEAQAMGRPVVATNHGGVRETVIANETAWLVPPGDAEAMAGALVKALALEGRAREELAQKAMAHIRERFTNERMCAKTLAVYAEILSAGAPESGPVSEPDAGRDARAEAMAAESGEG